MWRKSAVVVAGLSMAGSGCGLFVNGTRTVTHEFVRVATEAKDHIRNRLAADAAWKEVLCQDNCPAYSADYAIGFKAGFSDFISNGGQGVPPVMPPYRYTKTKYETVEGHRSIEDWYAGFQHGSAVAREKGYRDLLVIPSSLTALRGSATMGPVSAVEPARVGQSPPGGEARSVVDIDKR